MRRFWICCLIVFVSWSSTGCGGSVTGPPTAGPTTDPGGEAFSKPTKPIGPFFTEAEMLKFTKPIKNIGHGNQTALLIPR